MLRTRVAPGCELSLVSPCQAVYRVGAVTVLPATVLRTLHTLNKKATAITLLLVVLNIVDCDAAASVAQAPEGQGDLVVSRIRVVDTNGSAVARGKVSSSMRFLVTVRNQGQSAMPASVVRLSASTFSVTDLELGDLPVPALGPGEEAVADGALSLGSKLLSDFDRSRSENALIKACANATDTGVERNRANNCFVAPDPPFVVLPNFELECASTPVTLGAAAESPGTTRRCALVTLSPSLIRHLDVTAESAGVYVTEVRWLPGFFFAFSVLQLKVYDSSGTVVASGSSARGAPSFTVSFSAMTPGRYYIGTEAEDDYATTTSRQ